MIQIKLKNWTRRILIVMLSVLSFTLIAPTVLSLGSAHDGMGNVAYAADPPAEPVKPEPVKPVGPAADDAKKNADAPADQTPAEPDQTPADQAQTPADPATSAATVAPTEAASNDLLSKEERERQKNIISFVLSVQRFVNRILWPILMLTGGLLDNSILFGSGMEVQLRAIWVPIRNLTNIIFVLILVGIALYNVLGLGGEGENYALKSILPRIVVGIIAVNFSFLGIKVFLDGINALTIAIFALPDQVNEGLAEVIDPENPNDKDVIKRFCLLVQGESVSSKTLSATYAENLKATSAFIAAKQAARAVGFTGKIPETSTNFEATIANGYTKDPLEALVAQQMNKDKNVDLEDYKKTRNELYSGRICDGTTLSDSGKQMLRNFNGRSAPIAFVLNMSQIVFYSELPENIQNWEKITTNVLFSLMIYVIFIASFIALFIVLMARLVVLWLAVVISPILVLGYTVPVVKEKLSAFDTINDHFVKNAIAPIGIAFAMTVGWIMLHAIKSVNSFDSNTNGIFTASDIANIPVNGLNTVQDLMVMFGTVAVVWMGVFAAAEESIAGAVTGTIKSGLQSAAGWAVTTPLKNLPMVPIKLPGASSAENFSLGQVGQVFKNLDNASNQRINDLSKKVLGDGIQTTQDIRDSSSLNDVFTKLRDNNTQLDLKDPKVHEAFLDWMKKTKNKAEFEAYPPSALKTAAKAYFDAREKDDIEKTAKEFFTELKRDQSLSKPSEEAKPADTTTPAAETKPSSTADKPPVAQADATAAQPSATTPLPALGADAKIANLSVDAANLNLVNGLRGKYGTAPIDSSNKAAVVEDIKKIQLKDDGGNPPAKKTYAQVKDMLGEAKAKELLDAYPGSDEASKQAALEADLNPTPPTSPSP